MKLQPMRVVLDEKFDGFNFDQEVVIRTDKQLLPNANYDFEVEEVDGAIVLRPTTRK